MTSLSWLKLTDVDVAGENWWKFDACGLEHCSGSYVVLVYKVYVSVSAAMDHSERLNAVCTFHSLSYSNTSC